MTKDTNDTAHSPLTCQRAVGEQILVDKNGYYFCCIKSYKGKSKDCEVRAEIIKKCVNSHNDCTKSLRDIIACIDFGDTPRTIAKVALEKAGVTL